MIINPIIPIWLMLIICISAILIILYSKELKNKILKKSNTLENIPKKTFTKHNIINISIKISIIILLFIINLRFMLPNGEATAINSNLNILFVIDKSVSMRALDYNGSNERFEAVIQDCCYITNELSNCKFSIITFGDTAKQVIPFTTDIDMVQAELKSIKLENDFYASGTSINLVKDILYKTVEKQSKKADDNSKNILFFITDGEITKENEVLESFSNIKQYVSNGAVLGYGTTEGGKMVNSIYEDEPSSEYYYLYYYDDNYQMQTAISKLNEKNLKQIASDIGIDYIQMSKTSNIDYKISNIKEQISSSQTAEEKVSSYKDTYYYFGIPLIVLVIIKFIIEKRRLY